MDNAAGSDQVCIGLMRLVLVILFTVTLSTMALFMVILLCREIALYFQKRKHIKRAVVDGYDSSRISAENQRNHPGQMIDIHENYANDDKQDGQVNKPFDYDTSGDDAENLEMPHRASEVTPSYSSTSSQPNSVKVNIIEGTSSILSNIKSDFEIADNKAAIQIEQNIEAEGEDSNYESEESEEEQDIGQIDFEQDKPEHVKMAKKNLQIEVIDYSEGEVQQQEFQDDV